MKILYFLILCTLSAPLFAVSVNRVQVAPRKGVLIATVDLEKVFQTYPATKKAKQELERLVLLKENEIAVKRAEIFRITEEIAKIKAAPPPLPGFESGQAVPAAAETLSTGATQSLLVSSAPSVAPIVPPALNAPVIEELEAQLKTKQLELRQMEKNAEKNLEELEEAKTKTLLAKIYFSLRELAEEKHVDMIVDKNAILWGSSKLDLTDELMRKLKSVMIESE